MDFLSNLSKTEESKHGSAGPDDSQLRPSKSDLIHSAKVVADVAQAHLRHEPDKYDKAEAAAAAADLLNAASSYGKMDEKGIGKYVDKAEEYLRHYHSSGGRDGKMGGDSAKKQSHGGGGAGDFLKN